MRLGAKKGGGMDAYRIRRADGGRGGGGILRGGHFFATFARCSSMGSTLPKKLLCQNLCLCVGLPEVLTKHLSSGTSIASGRMCKGGDLDDGLLMTKL